jgi:glycine/D-amino acid oxidase-like deaminating enzyme
VNALPSRYDAIVLGAGAAGMMCALTAGGRGKRVLLVDHADAPGKKILISGGGRCNFTNIHTAADRYLSANPHFAKSALGRYTPQDFLALVESGMASPGTKRRWGSCSATARRGRSSTCWWRNVPPRGRHLRAGASGLVDIDHDEGHSASP